jgi:hypothetical protein
MQIISTCSVFDCKREHYAKGYCSAHWKRFWEKGSTESIRPLKHIVRHGLRFHPMYTLWNNMRQRCSNSKNKDYSRYGAQGVMVCKRWNNFANFLEDMGEKPEGQSLDRIDNKGNYTPENCRWATYAQQTHNSRVVSLNPKKVLEIRRLHNKGEITQKHLSILYGVHQSVISRIITNKIWKELS